MNREDYCEIEMMVKNEREDVRQRERGEMMKIII